jgi:hypothetical protein
VSMTRPMQGSIVPRFVAAVTCWSNRCSVNASYLHAAIQEHFKNIGGTVLSNSPELRAIELKYTLVLNEILKTVGPVLQYVLTAMPPNEDMNFLQMMNFVRQHQDSFMRHSPRYAAQFADIAAQVSAWSLNLLTELKPMERRAIAITKMIKAGNHDFLQFFDMKTYRVGPSKAIIDQFVQNTLTAAIVALSREKLPLSMMQALIDKRKADLPLKFTHSMRYYIPPHNFDGNYLDFVRTKPLLFTNTFIEEATAWWYTFLHDLRQAEDTIRAANQVLSKINKTQITIPPGFEPTAYFVKTRRRKRIHRHD